MSYLAKTPEGLLPCPHCGGEAEARGGSSTMPYIRCKSCGCRTRASYDMDKLKEAWNRRAGGACEQRRTRRTCHVESSHVEQEMGDYSYLEVELSCGHAFTWDDGTPPDYCPYCGSRVVGE